MQNLAVYAYDQYRSPGVMKQAAYDRAWAAALTLIVIVIAGVAALATIGLKTAAWRVTGSVGLLSDALESFVNLIGGIMALAMLSIAAPLATVSVASAHESRFAILRTADSLTGKRPVGVGGK